MHKLTLRVEDKLVSNAKKYAAQHGKSLSQLVADYFADLTCQVTEDEPLPPLTQSLKGLLADAQIDDAEKDYKKHLEDKYL